ncbi:MAG: electron transfer flavoprotein subunit alpha/FixB family protein [Chitinophagales bacterium]
MSVLVYIDQAKGQAKKAGLEAAYYASKVAEQMGTTATGIFLGEASESDVAAVGNAGVSKVLHINEAKFNGFDSKAFTKAIAEAADKEGATVVVLSYNQNGKLLGSRLSVRMQAGFVPGANGLPNGDFVVSKAVFSGKAVANYTFNTDKKIIGVTPNSVPPQKTDATASVEAFSSSVSDADFGTKVRSVEVVDGEIPLTEADKVVSAGRGLKGPENWGMVEELAREMGAATACSRPVADVGWRPHHEHVGQTGVMVRPDLYIAIGISGAIQHLAGVNQSKVIVVINNDAEAPFFKAADYGIVGDAFDVVPKFLEAFKKFKAAQ